MKNLLFLFIVVGLYNCSNGQGIDGVFNIDNSGTMIRFNNGVYQIQYANGLFNSNYYYEEGNVLKMAAFNNGADQDHVIVSMDNNQIIVETKSSPIQQFVLYRQNDIDEHGFNTNIDLLYSIEGYELYHSHYEAELKFVEFVLGQQMSEDDRYLGKQEIIKEFEIDPKSVLETANSLDRQMSKLYEIKDVGQIALARSMMVAQIYPELQKSDSYFLRMLEKYSPVVAIDEGLALTQIDLDGFISLQEFQAMNNEQKFSLSLTDRQAFYKYIMAEFYAGNTETKRSLCVLGVYSEYIQLTYTQMSQVQRQNNGWDSSGRNYTTGYEKMSLRHLPNNTNSVADQQAYLAAYRNQAMSEKNTYQMMSNMMLGSHAVAMNVASNIGGGDYWLVKYPSY